MTAGPAEQSTSDRDQKQSPVAEGQNGALQADPNAQDDSSASPPAAEPGVNCHAYWTFKLADVELLLRYTLLLVGCTAFCASHCHGAVPSHQGVLLC